MLEWWMEETKYLREVMLKLPADSRYCEREAEGGKRPADGEDDRWMERLEKYEDNMVQMRRELAELANEANRRTQGMFPRLVDMEEARFYENLFQVYLDPISQAIREIRESICEISEGIDEMREQLDGIREDN